MISIVKKKTQWLFSFYLNSYIILIVIEEAKEGQWKIYANFALQRNCIFYK